MPILEAPGGSFVHYCVLLFLFGFVAACQLLLIIVSVLECQCIHPSVQRRFSSSSLSLPPTQTRSPLKAAWDLDPEYACRCVNTFLYIMIAGPIYTSTDFCCTVLPASIVLKLHMPLRQRLEVSSLFLVGVVNTASAL